MTLPPYPLLWHPTWPWPEPNDTRDWAYYQGWHARELSWVSRNLVPSPYPVHELEHHIWLRGGKEFSERVSAWENRSAKNISPAKEQDG